MSSGSLKVLHVGGYPPPFGGVASHVKRLHALCRQAGLGSAVLKTTPADEPSSSQDVVSLTGPRVLRLGQLLCRLAKTDADIIHFHVSSAPRLLWAIAPALVVSTGRKRIVSLHSGSFVPACQSLPLPLRACMIRAFEHLDHILAANEVQARYVVNHLKVDRRRVSVVPAFLPPTPVNVDAFDALPRPLSEFCARFCSLAIVTGFARPYYGLHTAIEAAGRLKNALGLVAHIYTSGDGSYIEKIRRLAASQFNVYISESDFADEHMTALLMSARVFIRATSIDGDSVALREAAFLDRQIVATDCAPRPAGCLLYPFGNEMALAARLEEAMRDPQAGRIVECGLDGGVRILATYRRVAAGQIGAAANEVDLSAGR